MTEKRTRTRGNPSAPDYPIDGRKAAEAVQHVIGTLLQEDVFFPTARDVVRVVNAHPLTDAAIIYRQTNRQRLRAGTQRYFRFFGAIEGCRLVGVDLDAGACTLDLVWETPTGAMLVDVVVSNRTSLPGLPAFEGRVDTVFEAAAELFKERLGGVRVCVFGAPAKSLFISGEGEQSLLSEVALP